MTVYRWSEAKNARLKRERGITFEEIVVVIDAGHLLDVLKHRNPRRYPRQSMFVVVLRRYVYLVPFVQLPDAYFHKTMKRQGRRDPPVTCATKWSGNASEER